MRCPKCGVTLGIRIMWGKEHYYCFECKYRRKVKKEEVQYYYERDAVENKAGLIEKMSEHL